MEPSSQPGKAWQASTGAVCAAVAVAGVLAAGLFVEQAVDGADEAAAKSAKRVILSPRSGARLPARPVRIRVRAGKRATVWGKLNGHSLGAHFKRPRPGVRRLKVSPSHGLRHGRNALRVTVKRRGGEKRSERSRFRVRRSRPLAAAGLDVTLTRGQSIRLDGAKSRSHRPPSRGLQHRWTIVHKPRGSSVDLGTRIGTRSDEDGSSTAIVEPDLAGKYRLGLRVADSHGTRGRDNVTVDVVNPPMVDVDTMTEASGGAPGIRVGSDRYNAKWAPDGDPPWFQVVVLDRNTLKPPANVNVNKTYLCHRASNGPCDGGELQRDLANLDDTKLVIAANHRSDPAWAAPGFAPFARIGARNFGANDLPGSGSFSAIGVPSTPAGEGPWHIESSGAVSGRITGSLIQDNWGAYTFLAPRITLDTQVLGSNGSNDQQNVMRVGGQTFMKHLDLDANQAGRGGFHVVVLDRMHPEQGAGNHWFPTGLQNFDSGEAGRLNAMTATLQQANASGNKLVIIASRGNPAAQGAGRQDQWENVSNAARRLVDQIEALGGTRTAAFQALAPGVTGSGASYTLIGWSGAGTAHGIESHGNKVTASRGLNDVALSGSLVRGPDYRFEVGDTAPSQIGNSTAEDAGGMLNETLAQAPTPWPDHDNPGQQHATKYIGDQLFPPKYDVRTWYWKSADSDSWWQDQRTAVGKLDYPDLKTGDPDPDFTPADLTAAKAQIQKEITWFLRVRNLTGKLAAPFSDNGLQNWAAVGDVAARVNLQVTATQEDKAYALAATLFNGAREAATAIPEVGEVIGAINAVYDVSLEITRLFADDLKETDEPFEVTASQFGKEMVGRLNAARGTLTNQITGAIVADYGKLRRVAVCTTKDANPLPEDTCPDDMAAWEFDKPDQTAASKALNYGTEAQAWSALVPARWELWKLNDDCPGSAFRTCWEDDFQGDGFYGQVGAFNAPVCPFMNEPKSAKLIRPVYRDIPRYRNQYLNPGDPSDIWQVYALGNLNGAGLVNNWYWTELPGNFLQRAFAPVDPNGAISKGGLGLQREAFFLGNRFKVKLMASSAQGGQAYPYKDSHPFWYGRNTDCVQWDKPK